MEVSSSYPVLGKRRLVAENSRFYVYLDELISGEQLYTADYLAVESKQITSGVVTGVAVLPLYQGKIGLIRSFRHPLREHFASPLRHDLR